MEAVDRREMNAMPPPPAERLEMDVRASREEHAFRVIPRVLRLGYRDGNAGDAGGEEDRALHLSARRFAVIVDRAQVAAGDRHWQATVLGQCHVRAHLLER